MPEIKNTFLQGKMNKDLDERLIPNGQYRDAMNVEVSTSEGASAGVVKNILGNKRIDVTSTFPGIPDGFKCVGSVANEKTNKLYWFISSYTKDAIIEHDTVNDKINPVLVDVNAGNSKAVLKFSGNIITGINIINNLLFWTDNNSEPKKINIDECKKGTFDLDTHTQLVFDHGSFNGMTLKIIASGSDLNDIDAWPPETPVGEMSKIGKYFYFQRKQLLKLLNLDFNEVTNDDGYIINAGDQSGINGNDAYSTSDNQGTIRHYRNGEFLGIKQIIFFDNQDGCLARNLTNSNENDWHVGDVIFGSDITIDIEERHITVIKPKPLKALTIKINHTQALNSTSNVPNLFETTFPRFSYRYKYKDGEFSAFAPFTEPVFNPKYTKDINNTGGANVFYTQDNVYNVKDPHNKAMVNSIHSVELTDFITAQTPEDAIEIEVLYKQEDSSVIYSIDTIKQTDPKWHDWSNNEGANIGLGKQIITNDLENSYSTNSLESLAWNYAATGGYIKGKYIVTTENIYAALPANQLLRPWDNVPRKALGQEITGNRIVYGNYLQNYNLGNIKPEIKVGYNDRNNQLGTFENQGLPSIKSQRNYQLGVIYCDKYGRETPVFTSSEGAVSIPWQKADGTKNASKSLQLNASVVNSFPEWVDSFKIFVKETSSPYYNLVMDRAWVAKSTYELDRGDHLWISFPSSDRNKISEEDYIILKKKIGAGEEQIAFENKFKVIDVANEAPDAIKYELINMGVATNTSNIITNANHGIFPPGGTIAGRPDREGRTQIAMQISAWRNYGLWRSELIAGNNDDAPDVSKNLYVSWRRLSGGVGGSSKKYKVTDGWKSSSTYHLTLSTPITKIDADLAHVDGDSSAFNEVKLHADLIFQVEKRVLKDSEDFSGKFFVKISKNQVTDLIEEGSTTDLLDNYIVSSKTPTWYWQDDEGQNVQLDNANYGLTNYNGYSADHSAAADNIQSAAQNDFGDGHPLAGTANAGLYGSSIKLTDHKLAWNGIKENFNNTFFIDSMHMVAGQSFASNYAKYCCVTWAGCTKDQDGSKEISSWSYPPLKTWLSDWMNSESSFLSGGQLFGTYYRALKSGLIETAPITSADDDFKLLTLDASGEKVTGWAGPSQFVNRHTPSSGFITINHVNGLEGIVTTTTDHSVGPRRWTSGITGNATDNGVGVDTKTYSEDGETGRHFMHLSFFAPGQDLHNGSFTATGTGAAANQAKLLGNSNAIGSRLQGIWGGGVFTGGNTKHPDLLEQLTFGTGGIGYASLPMEGNNDPNDSNRWLPETPGPGVGFGYNLDFQELHERQWDPTFCDDGDEDNKIRDFIRNLHAGSQFKFSSDTIESVYTIKKVVVKKLYNHTSWRTPFNRYQTTGKYHATLEDDLYQSVEETGLNWLDTLNDSGVSGGDATDATYKAFTDKIVDFGKAHNRRLCYIIELDKNPTESTSFNPLLVAAGGMTADLVNSDFANIEFLEKVQSTLLAGLNKFPAIWETDPKRQEVNLDIYYEASNNIPIKLNEQTNELIAPLGCKVEMIGMGSNITSRVLSWDGTVATLEPGLPVGDETIEIEYSGIPFKFTKEDGSFVMITSDEQQLLGQSVSSTEFKTSFVFRHDIGENVRVGLAWNNCFSFGNGLESNRIRDDFNEIFITNGVKASTTTQQTYEEEHRAHGLIYSGLYNSNSGVNDLNQFIMAEKITKDLNPTYGSIQKLFSRSSDLVTFCEDRVIKVLANKDAVFNADGNPQLTANENVLGQTIPFSGEYGISTNPESFASESYRAYFTDKQRGAVIRLSKDGLTPISKNGMHDWFRDNLQNYSSLIGSYDSYKEDYNVSLSHAFGENFIYNAYLGEGVELSTQEGSLFNFILNPAPVGDSLVYYRTQYEGADLGGDFEWGPQNVDLDAIVSVTNHDSISSGEYQVEILAGANQLTAATDDVYTTIITTSAGVQVAVETTSLAYGTDVSGGVDTAYSFGSGTSATGTFTVGTDTSAESAYDQIFIDAADDDTPYTAPTYSTDLSFEYFDGSVGTPALGHLYKPFIQDPNKDLWGPTNSETVDQVIYSEFTRTTASVLVNEQDPYAHPEMTYHAGALWANAGASKDIYYGYSLAQGYEFMVSNSITRGRLDQYVGGDGIVKEGFVSTSNIVFDRVKVPDEAFVEFKSIGDDSFQPMGAGLNQTYIDNGGTGVNQQHSAIFNGDEIHIQFEIVCYPTHSIPDATDPAIMNHGWNVITPYLEIRDGSDSISSSILKNYSTFGSGVAVGGFQTAQTNYNPFLYQQTLPDTQGGMGFEPFSVPSNNFSQLAPSSYVFASTNKYHAISKVASSVPSITFPTTASIDQLYGVNALQNPKATIVCGASFKFIDPNQQSPSGANNPGYNITDTDGVFEQVVVQDLRVRIGNMGQPGYYPWSGNSKFPLWEIKNVRVQKSFGVTAPFQAFDANDPGQVAITTSAFTTVAGGLAATYETAQPAIPPAAVPAWVEVDHQHFGNNNWELNPALPIGNTSLYNSYLSAQTIASTYGPNFLGNQVTYTLADNTTTGSYLVPENYSAYPLGENTNDPQTGGLNSGNPNVDFNEVLDGDIILSDNYLRVETPTTGGVDLEWNIGPGGSVNTPWQTGVWYLVDVEFDKPGVGSFGTSVGNGGNDGIVYVLGTTAPGVLASGAEIDSEGTGVYQDGIGSCRLVQVNRTEYSDSKTVLRGLFKIESGSAISTSSNGEENKFVLRFKGFVNEVDIVAIHVKKMSSIYAPGGNGEADSPWVHTAEVITHSFSKRELYYKNGKMCWDVKAVNNNNNNAWEQVFNSNSLVETPAGYTLKFTIGDNPDTGNHTGNLRVICNNDIGPAGFEGAHVQDLVDTGDYEINFNFTEGSTEVSPGTNWSIYKDTNVYTTATYSNSSNNQSWSSNSIGNRIWFAPNNASVDFRMAISDLSLIDNTLIFQGGTSGSWNWDGFNTSLESFVVWDDESGRIQFGESDPDDAAAIIGKCPFVDPSSISIIKTPISASQWVDRTINRYEKYNIEFTHGIIEGSLDVYYFNAEGFGFRIGNISGAGIDANGLAIPVEVFKQVVIGLDQNDTNNQYSEKRSALHPAGQLYEPELQETFVITPSAYDENGNDITSSNEVFGWIDNVSMTKVFNIELDQNNEPIFEEKTVTFSEGVNGWTSFKSFVAESGVSLSKNYFTFDEGKLFKHYVPLAWVLSDNGYDYKWQKSTVEHAENYNIFYNNYIQDGAIIKLDPEEHSASKIKFVLNNEPSVVKMFNTLNYEGTQTYVTKPAFITDVNINNALAWSSNMNIQGWKCKEIKTDLDAGTVLGFIKKEGKWFNYIKGKPTTNLDTSRFSVQGIGVME